MGFLLDVIRDSRPRGGTEQAEGTSLSPEAEAAGRIWRRETLEAGGPGLPHPTNMPPALTRADASVVPSVPLSDDAVMRPADVSDNKAQTAGEGPPAPTGSAETTGDQEAGVDQRYPRSPLEVSAGKPSSPGEERPPATPAPADPEPLFKPPMAEPVGTRPPHAAVQTRVDLPTQAAAPEQILQVRGQSAVGEPPVRESRKHFDIIAPEPTLETGLAQPDELRGPVGSAEPPVPPKRTAVAVLPVIALSRESARDRTTGPRQGQGPAAGIDHAESPARHGARGYFESTLKGIKAAGAQPRAQSPVRVTPVPAEPTALGFERNVARPATRTVEDNRPRVHIGQVDIVVHGRQEPPAQARPSGTSTNLASRLYLRSV